MKELAEIEEWLTTCKLSELSADDLKQLKSKGFSDSQIARLIGGDGARARARPRDGRPRPRPDPQGPAWAGRRPPLLPGSVCRRPSRPASLRLSWSSTDRKSVV